MMRGRVLLHVRRCSEAFMMRWREEKGKERLGMLGATWSKLPAFSEISGQKIGFQRRRWGYACQWYPRGCRTGKTPWANEVNRSHCCDCSGCGHRMRGVSGEWWSRGLPSMLAGRRPRRPGRTWAIVRGLSIGHPVWLSSWTMTPCRVYGASGGEEPQVRRLL